MTQSSTLIGESVTRTGLEAKVRGAAEYTADLKRPGMLYGRILRSPHPHARIRSIDVSKAAGAAAASTPSSRYKDVPHVRIDADLVPLDRRSCASSATRSRSSRLRANHSRRTPWRLSRSSTKCCLPFSMRTMRCNPARLSCIQHAEGNLVGGAALDVRARRRRSGPCERGTAVRAAISTRRCTALRAWRRAPPWRSGTATMLTVWKTSRAVHAVDRRTLARVLEHSRGERPRGLHHHGRRLRQQG